MRNIKSVNKIMEVTGERYDKYFLSELLFKFKNLTGTQMNTIKNILYYNNLSSMDELEEHINNCFNYSESKSSANYKKFMYGDDGYNKWLENYNSVRNDSKSKNLENSEYIKKTYCVSIDVATDHKFGIDFIYELVKDYVPLSEINRDIILRVLKLNRFKTVNEYYNNIKSLIDYKGSRSNNNSEYGIMLLGENEYNVYINNLTESSKKTKRENFLNRIDSVERYTRTAKTIIKNYNITNHSLEFVTQLIKDSNEFDINNTVHHRWVAEQLIYQNFGSIDNHIKNLSEIINFKGNRKHSIEWETLRYGKEEAEIRHKKASYLITSTNNPKHVLERLSKINKKDKMNYIKGLFDKKSNFYVDKGAMKFEQTFYMIHVSDDIYKVGNTQDFKLRFLNHSYNKTVMVYNTNLYEALLLEIIFKILYCEKTIEENDDYGYTETFRGLDENEMIDTFKKIKCIIDKETSKANV